MSGTVSRWMADAGLAAGVAAVACAGIGAMYAVGTGWMALWVPAVIGGACIPWGRSYSRPAAVLLFVLACAGGWLGPMVGAGRLPAALVLGCGGALGAALGAAGGRPGPPKPAVWLTAAAVVVPAVEGLLPRVGVLGVALIAALPFAAPRGAASSTRSSGRIAPLAAGWAGAVAWASAPMLTGPSPQARAEWVCGLLGGMALGAAVRGGAAWVAGAAALGIAATVAGRPFAAWSLGETALSSDGARAAAWALAAGMAAPVGAALGGLDRRGISWASGGAAAAVFALRLPAQWHGAGVAAIAAFCAARSGMRLAPRIATVLAALALGTSLLALRPLPPVGAAWRHIGAAGRAFHWRGDPEARHVADSDGGCVRGVARLVCGGEAVPVDARAFARDRLFGHLPALLRGSFGSALLVGAGSGGAADALRKTGNTVLVWEERDALRRLAANDPEPSAAFRDPAVRLVGSNPLRGRGRWDAVLIDLPAPIAPSPFWTRGDLAGLSAYLSPGGIAVLRVPVLELATDDFVGLAHAFVDAFPTVLALLGATDAGEVFLIGSDSGQPFDAARLIDAWSRAALRADLAAAGLRAPEELLERALATRDGLLALDLRPLDPAVTIALRATSRIRSARRTLPLGALATAATPLASAWDFGMVPEPRRGELVARLGRADRGRELWLQLQARMLEGRVEEALALAGRLGAESESPARDLRGLVEPWVQRGLALLESGRVEEARGELATAHAFSPRDPEIDVALAEAERRLGRLDEAEALYRMAVAEPGAAAAAAIGLADTLLDRGRPAEAADALEAAEKASPGDARLLTNLGWVHTQLAVGAEENIRERLGRARVLFQRAIAIRSDAPHPHAGLAEVLYREGNFEQALTEIDLAIAWQPDCAYSTARGHILAALLRLPEARESLLDALLRCPDRLDALVMLGAVEVDSGRVAEGRARWERVLALDPDNEAARANIETLEQSGLEQLQR